MEYMTAPEPLTLDERIVAALATGPASRSQLCDILHVSRPVLGRSLARLMDSGVVVSLDADTVTDGLTHVGRGRPVHYLALADRLAHAVGIDIERTSCTGVILDRQGNILASASLSYDRFDGWFTPLSLLCARLDVAARDEGLDMSALTGVGVGLPVPVGYRVWREEEAIAPVASVLRDEIEKYWKAPILVDNAVRIAALGEARWGAGKHHSNQLYVRLSGGIGACVIISSKLAGGGLGYAGELGHISVPGNTTPCQCGKSGCLETVASASAVCAAAGVSNLSGLRRALDTGEPRAHDALIRACQAMGQACANVVLMLNPTRIILGGDLAATAPEIVGHVHSAMLNDLIPCVEWDVDVVTAELDTYGAARGAVAAVDTHLAERRAHALLEANRQFENNSHKGDEA